MALHVPSLLLDDYHYLPDYQKETKLNHEPEPSMGVDIQTRNQKFTIQKVLGFVIQDLTYNSFRSKKTTGYRLQLTGFFLIGFSSLVYVFILLCTPGWSISNVALTLRVRVSNKTIYYLFMSHIWLTYERRDGVGQHLKSSRWLLSM